MHRRLTTCLLLALAAALPVRGGDDRPTGAFREEHAEIREHLDHLDAAVGALATAPPEEQARKMAFVARFLHEHIRAHAAWEEEVLYPIVDEKAGGGKERFTATMRHEHVIVGRWIDELRQQAEAPRPDVVAFARRAHRLLGLIAAHFEEEEEVLLTLLDRTLTADEFRARIGARSPHGR